MKAGGPRPDADGAPRSFLSGAVFAGAAAAVVSGLPSTVHAWRTGADPLEASYAAGALLLRDEQRPGRLLAAAALVHGAMSLGWAVVLAGTLPRRRAAAAGGAAGAAIAVLDLGLVGRRFPRVRQLPVLPQLADHVTYGAVVGAVLEWRRARRPDVVARRAVAASPAQVFDFLADLRNHWLLEDRFVELAGLDDEGSSPLGGWVRLTGPLGIRREARTRVLSAHPPAAGVPGRLAGRADIGARTTGRVSWEIVARADGGSLVTLAAVAERTSLLDRMLIACGRWWLQRTFDHALANLDRVLHQSSAGGGPGAGRPLAARPAVPERVCG